VSGADELGPNCPTRKMVEAACGSEGRGFESRWLRSHILYKPRGVYHLVERRDVATMVIGSLWTFTITIGLAEV
jgi:hypothetical protein